MSVCLYTCKMMGNIVEEGNGTEGNALLQVKGVSMQMEWVTVMLVLVSSRKRAEG